MNTLAGIPVLSADARQQTMDAVSLMNGASSADVPVFARLGIIVRALHDTLRELGAEGVLAEAASEFPSARDRLLHIATLTENAANTVLSKVEESVPTQDLMAQTAAALHEEWSRVAASGLPQVEHAALVERTKTFMSHVQAGCAATHTALSDIMMAQDFQDLTGQLIKKVVGLIERTETDLLKLLIDAAPPGTAPSVKTDDLMAGPGAPGSVALQQASVDDLLADLGF